MTPIRARTRTLLKELPPLRPARLADVGARPGMPPPYALLMEYELAELWGFEPNREAFEALCAAATPAQHYHNVALGDGTCRPFYDAPNGYFSSLLRPVAPGFDLIGEFARAHTGVVTQEVSTTRLDDLADVPPLDLLKIDIQGGELLVLEHATQKLAQAVCVIPEVRFLQFYADEPMFGGIDAALRQMGFMLHKFQHVKSHDIANSQKRRYDRAALSSQLVDGDAIYIRDITMPERVDDTQWAMLALLADCVFDSPDLVMLALDTLKARGVCRPGAAVRYLRQLPQDVLMPGAFDRPRDRAARAAPDLNPASDP